MDSFLTSFNNNLLFYSGVAISNFFLPNVALIWEWHLISTSAYSSKWSAKYREAGLITQQ